MISNVENEEVGCILGCPKNDDIILVGRDLLHNLPGEYTVVKCRSCGLIRTSPRPTLQTIEYYYPENYSPFISTRIRMSHRKNRSPFRVRIGRLLSGKIWNTARLPKLARGRMLEVGCASGSFLDYMATDGWLVAGIEPSVSAAQAATESGFNVYVGSLDTAPCPDEPYDLIVGWMVLEHLHNPIDGLRRLRQWAKPGTYLVLSVPNAASMDFRIFRENWYALQVPTHLFHFTPTTLQLILKASGWKLEQVFHQRVISNWIASAGYVLRAAGRCDRLSQYLIDFPQRSGIPRLFLYPIGFFLSIFGQSGRMTIWAKVDI